MEQMMAWNEPGGGKRRDPWQGGGGGGGGGGEPPDLDAMLKRLKDNINKALGGGGGRGGAGRAGPGIWLLVIGVLAAWFLLDSWRTIDETQRGVVLRFGEYNRTMGPGLNFKWPGPIEQVLVVEATRVRSTSDQVRILTRDENLVEVGFNVQYRVSDPRAFLFGLRDPDVTIQQAAESAVRDVIGSNTMDAALSGQLAELSSKARDVLQQTLDEYAATMLTAPEGVPAPRIFDVAEFNFQTMRPPNEVEDAFDDAIKAREDKQRLESEAKAYANKVVPEARGAAARLRAEAEGDSEAAVALAEGQTARFSLLAEQYRAAPDVTRQRLFIETMQSVLQGSPKVMVEGGGDKVLYLPLDQIGNAGRGGATLGEPGFVPRPSASSPAMTTPAIEAARATTRDTGRSPVREGGRN
jgi:membrane protease subunit HflK